MPKKKKKLLLDNYVSTFYEKQHYQILRFSVAFFLKDNFLKIMKGWNLMS